MNKQQLSEIMTSDIEKLKEQELTNLCLVKKINSDGILEPSHIVFNFWFNCTFVSLRAIINEDLTYQIWYRDTRLYKSIKVEDFTKKLNKYNADIQLTYGGQIQNIQFYKKGRKRK